MKQIIKEFLDYCTFEKGFSPNTLDQYKRNLKVFYEDHKQYKFDSISQQMIVTWLAGREFKPASVKSYICTLKGLFKFAVLDGYIDQNPIRYLELPKLNTEIPEIFGYEQFETIIAAANETAYDLRNTAIFEVLYGCGLRVSELCNLKLSDLRDDKLLRVTGKGSKERIVPIGKFARNSINKYLKGTKIKKRYTDHIFLSRYGTQLTRHTINKICTEVEIITKIPNIYPHRFRHSYATELLLKGADIRVVQALLGHENIQNTEVYLHLKLSDVVEKFKKTHPRYNAT